MDMQKCTYKDEETLMHMQGDEENKLLKDESRHTHKKKHFLHTNTSERRMPDGPWRPHVIRDCNPVTASLISPSKS